MSFRLHKWHAFVAGLAGGLFVFAIGREVWWAFANRSAGEVISEALSAIGSLRWIDTTLITGMAAVAAAFVSVRAVRDQIRQAAGIEKDRREAKLAAARAILPLTLSELCGYAQESAEALMTLRSKCVGDALPRSVAIPNFPAVPDGVISNLKEAIEFLDAKDRVVLTKLIADIQVQATRMLGLHADRRRLRHESRRNIEVYIGDAAKIYARVSALFEYARGETQHVPTSISERDIYTAVHLVGIYHDELASTLVARIYRHINDE